MIPGIHTIDIDAYHSGPGVSKTGLHKILTSCPYNFRFGERKATNPQNFGKAAHVAVLEPNHFERDFMRGPDDRRGNKWGAAQEMAAAAGKECLTSGDYDDAMRLRDILHRDPMLRRLTAGAPAIEQSAYAIDEVTGELVRVRPDLFNHDMRAMVDLKSCASIGTYDLLRSFVNFSYNLQGEMYPSIWEKAGGGPVDAFVFLCVEKDAPHAYRWVELSPGALEEGAAMYRKALGIYHDCMEAERQLRRDRTGAPECRDLDAYLASAWPMYGTEVETLEWPAYAYKLTKREVE